MTSVVVIASVVGHTILWAASVKSAGKYVYNAMQ